MRIYMDGNLLDEFKCDNEEVAEISTREIGKLTSARLGCFQEHTTFETFKFLTPKRYKVIELDSSAWLDEEKLVIEVFNNNSDYNNGFMTKRSLVLISPVFLIPKETLDNKSTMYKIITRLTRAKWVAFIEGIKNRKDHTKTKPKRLNWPGICADSDTVALESLLCKGGNFKVTFNIRKKYKTHTLVHNNQMPHAFFHVDRFFLAWYQNYSKNYFDLAYEQSYNVNKRSYNLSLKEKNKEINTANEDQ